MANQAGYAVAAAMEGKPGVTVTQLPSMVRIDAEGRLEFDYGELSDAVGEEFDQNASRRSSQRTMDDWSPSMTGWCYSRTPRTPPITWASIRSWGSDPHGENVALPRRGAALH